MLSRGITNPTPSKPRHVKTQNLCRVRKKIQHLPRLHSVSPQRAIAAQSAGEFTLLHRRATFFAKESGLRKER